MLEAGAPTETAVGLSRGIRRVWRLYVIATAILPWRTAHDPLEGCAEGAFGFVAERQGDGGNRIAPEEAANHFGWFAAFAGLDCPASSKLTQELLGWQPKQPGLIPDLDRSACYFEN
jgi:hypothetical protein